MPTKKGPSSTILLPSPTVEFTLDSPSPTSCAPFGINWFYSGPDQPLSLLISNDNVPQDPPPPPPQSQSTPPSTQRPPNTFINALADFELPTAAITNININLLHRAIPTALEPSTPPPLLTIPITTLPNPYSLGYEWPLVNVPPGWYTLTASIPLSSYTRVSRAFYVWPNLNVAADPDTAACLAALPSPSSAGGDTITPPVSTGTPTGAGDGTSTPGSGSGPVPVGSSSTTSIGTIVGISVAAVVVVAVILGAWLCLVRRKRRMGASAGGAGGGGWIGGERDGGVGRWNGLSSTDSRNVLTGGGYLEERGGGKGRSKSKPRDKDRKGTKEREMHGERGAQRARRESYGSTMMSDADGEGVEKSKMSFDGSVVLAGLPVLNSNAKQREYPYQNQFQNHNQNQNYQNQQQHQNQNQQQQQRRNRTYSQSSSTSYDYSYSGDYVPTPGGGSRRPSASATGGSDRGYGGSERGYGGGGGERGRKMSVDSSTGYAQTGAPNGGMGVTAYPPQSPLNTSWSGVSPSSNGAGGKVAATYSQSSVSVSPVSPSGGNTSGDSYAAGVHGSNGNADVARPTTSASAATKQANRQSLGGKKRKPVPVYDPDESVNVPALPGDSPQPQSQSQSQFQQPPQFQQSQQQFESDYAQQVYNSQQQPQPHYTTRTHAGRDASQHSLHHKGSLTFEGMEGRQMHLLMPDMPV
ncbi:hypothetical protein CVT24_012470, partial [Panaeolus cyanescens]